MGGGGGPEGIEAEVSRSFLGVEAIYLYVGPRYTSARSFLFNYPTLPPSPPSHPPPPFFFLLLLFSIFLLSAFAPASSISLALAATSPVRPFGFIARRDFSASPRTVICLQTQRERGGSASINKPLRVWTPLLFFLFNSRNLNEKFRVESLLVSISKPNTRTL